MKSTRFIPLSDWAKHHPWPTPGAFRVQICKAEKAVQAHGSLREDSILSCVVRIGRRVLIDEQKFIAWVRKHSPNEQDYFHGAGESTT